MTTKETIENNIKEIAKELNNQLSFAKNEYSLDEYKDEISDLLIYQYMELRDVSNEETVTLKIGVNIGQFLDINKVNKVSIAHSEVKINTNLILISGVALEGTDFKYYKKRLLNVLKDNKHLKIEVNDSNINENGVLFKTAVQVNKQEILTKIARIAVATFAQKNLKSRATVEQDGVKIEVFREEVK